MRMQTGTREIIGGFEEHEGTRTEGGPFMTNEILFSGFGGQGVLSMGMTLAYAGMIEGKEVSWMPSYGPEMRGGTANCIVIVSSFRISSPIVTTFDSAIILNQPSLEKFQPAMKKQGLLLYEQSSVINGPSRGDIESLAVPAVQEALRLGKRQVANMVMLGAFLTRSPIVGFDSVLQALKKTLPERHHHLMPLNEQALEVGRRFAQSPRERVSGEPRTVLDTER